MSGLSAWWVLGYESVDLSAIEVGAAELLNGSNLRGCRRISAAGVHGDRSVAADAVAVTVKVVDVYSDDFDRALHVGGTVAAAARAVDVTRDRYTCAAVVWVALLGLLCTDRDDLPSTARTLTASRSSYVVPGPGRSGAKEARTLPRLSRAKVHLLRWGRL
jgi:hypothetical protein